MSGVVEGQSEIVASKRTLVEYMEAGCKPPEAWRIGTEHEKFAYRLEDLRPLDYEGGRGIRALLTGLSRFGWQPILEGGNVIALKDAGGGFVSLEPAGQVELSGAPVQDIHETCTELQEHLRQVKILAGEMGIGFLGLGYQPKWPLAEMPWMPKGRYKIMRDYMPKVGGKGLEMMQATCTVQVNLDFSSEATMVQMFRVSLALQPIATALWANSPFKEGKPSGFLSYRSHVWTDTDGARSGIPAFVFEDGFGFERYVDYALDVPMYFVYRDGRYIDASGQSFRDFMDARLPALAGERPTLADWANHLSTLFPEVRLKRYLEMRGADGGPWNRLCALSAFWTGLLYDPVSRDAAWQMVKDWTPAEIQELRREVPYLALNTPFRGTSVGDIAIDVLELAHRGLCHRKRFDALGRDETHFLNPLFQIADSGFTLAEELLFAYERRWKGSVDPVFREYAY
ncbi:MAG: glutamate--cysteine ligase [Magnetospirillum sp. WYHS-4]